LLADISAGAPARSSGPVQPADPVASASIARTAVPVLLRGTLHGRPPRPRIDSDRDVLDAKEGAGDRMVTRPLWW
jgi:hypothetical protein